MSYGNGQERVKPVEINNIDVEVRWTLGAVVGRGTAVNLVGGLELALWN